MGHPGDDDVTDRHTFDPGVETGYLRRSKRDRPLDPELGAAPFDPGAGAGYDDRRARKAAKRREREEREWRQKEQRELEEEQRRRAALFARRPSGAPGRAAAAAAPALEPAEVEPVPEIELASEPARVTELPRLRPAKPSLAKRLERERAERAEAESERRAQVERERAEREREEREKRERRRRDRDERLRRDREALRKRRPQRKRRRRRPNAKPAEAEAGSATAPAAASPAHPVRVTRPHPPRHRELIWPTAKAGIAVTVVLGVAAALGSVVGLPVPDLNTSAGKNSVLSSASLFGVDAGTPQGLAGGFVFPIGAPPPHDYGEAAAKFGAGRSGHVHEGQDVFARPGTPLMAVRDGVVVDGGGGKSLYAYGGGNSFVMYSPTDNRSYVYLHMLHPSPLHTGDQVHAGQLVGQVGCTGSCDGPHLHFEIRLGKVAYGHEGKPIDPLPYLRQWEQLGTPG